MIKSELISKISLKQDHLSESDIALSINTIIKKMVARLTKGGRIEIRDFGNFTLHYRPPRQAHNPKTGKKLVTEPKYALHFKPGKGLKDRLNIAKEKNIPLQE